MELVKLPPHLPVTLVEPRLIKLPPQHPVELAERVLLHPLVASGALGLAIYGNPIPQISESPMN